ncbi:MAG: hypothetical protein Q8O99_05935 [bacterium]|nr:hypothetical protein [bacterium]
MHFVFELCKLLFFVSALTIAVLKWKGAELLDPARADVSFQLFLPGFFMLAGIMI